MYLMFVHDCISKDEDPNGCPVADREFVIFSPPSVSSGLNQYIVPDVRCLHTNKKIKLVAVDGNRDI